MIIARYSSGRTAGKDLPASDGGFSTTLGYARPTFIYCFDHIVGHIRVLILRCHCIMKLFLSWVTGQDSKYAKYSMPARIDVDTTFCAPSIRDCMIRSLFYHMIWQILDGLQFCHFCYSKGNSPVREWNLLLWAIFVCRPCLTPVQALEQQVLQCLLHHYKGYYAKVLCLFRSFLRLIAPWLSLIPVHRTRDVFGPFLLSGCETVRQLLDVLHSSGGQFQYPVLTAVGAIFQIPCLIHNVQYAMPWDMARWSSTWRSFEWRLHQFVCLYDNEKFFLWCVVCLFSFVKNHCQYLTGFPGPLGSSCNWTSPTCRAPVSVLSI